MADRARNPSAAQEFYGRWARLYDGLCRYTPGLDSVRASAVDALALQPGETVVEMGCGTGANFPHLRERVGPEGRVIGVDFTRGMLAHAHERVRERGWENVEVIQADAERAPVTGSVDAVLATFVVGMFSDPASVVDGWLDLLSPGGRIALLDATRSNHVAGRPLNAAFQAFVTVSAPGKRRQYAEPPWELLDERVAAARGVLADRTEITRENEAALGFLRLTAGRVETRASSS